MSSLLFLLKCHIKNFIKGAFKKPVVLIGYILMLVFFAFVIIASFTMPGGSVRSASPDLFNGIMILVFLFLYFTSLKLGIEKGSTYFRMADVNLAFTAPVKPNHILFYGFIKQLGGTLLLIFFAMFQIPNLRNNFILKPYGVSMLLLAVAAFALSYPLISMIIYSWVSKSKEKKKLLKRIFNAGAMIVAVLFLINLSETRNIGLSISNIFNHPIAKYFPVVGWTGSIASSAINGFTPEFWTGASGMVILIIGASVALYYMNLDFYEDVLEGTEYVEAAYKAKHEGKSMTFNLKVKKNVNQKLFGTGAVAIFSKQLLEIRRTAYFLFFDVASITVIGSAIAFKLLMPEDTNDLSLFMILCFSVYMLLIFQMQGRLGTELDKPYIFLIPASSQQKLFYATAPEHIKNILDGMLLFMIAGILFKGQLPVVIACIITYASFGAVFVYSDILCRRLFGWTHSKGLSMFIKVIVVLLIQIPGIAAAVITGMATDSEFLVICALGGWSLILAATFFVFSAGILNNLESAG